MKGRVLISYRREDAAAHAGRLSDRLTDMLDENSVFMDVDSIDWAWISKRWLNEHSANAA
jgi:hypothetical protein